ncbi:MAG: ATP-binding protein [Simkaniaceae bacterium]
MDDPDSIQCELAGACRDEFNVSISPEIRVDVIYGKSLVVAFIPEMMAREKPVYLKKLGIEKGAFRRVGSSDRHCTERDRDLLYQLRSGVPFEAEVLPDTSWEDIDPEAVAAYRRQRAKIEPNAAELDLHDEGLLRALNCLVCRNGVKQPNVAGLLLFGTKAALRRTLPIDSRVDYVITEGPEWINDPSSRHFSIDYREALITLMPRLHTEIISDLPKLFGLEPGKLQRTETPIIPRDVIREALANALMHRDYRGGQPTLVIRYSNRLEFKNAGYSLKPFEELGQPGSKQRNLIIAGVFHELNFAETKGTGIASMREWMKKAGLDTPPIFESDRDKNEFDLVLLPHHLLDQQDLEWLSQFRAFKLNDADLRALVVAREMRAITNQDYRQVNRTDTLTASRALTHLRDLGLLSMKGSGNGTYYVLSEQLFAFSDTPAEGGAPHTNGLSGGLTPHTNALYDGLTPHINPLYKGLDALPKGFPPLSDKLKQQLTALGKRSQKAEIKDFIKKLCTLGPLQLAQLAKIIDRDPRYLRNYYLSGMIRSGELVYLYPDQPAHPQQAYKTPSEEAE